jgi:hypothetical protein
MLTNTLKAKLHIICQHVSLSSNSISQFPYKISSDFIVVVVSNLILEHHSVLFEKFPDKSLVFAVIDNGNYDMTPLMSYPVFNVTKNCDELLAFLSLKMVSQTKTQLPQGIHAATIDTLSRNCALNQQSENNVEKVAKMDDVNNVLTNKYESVSEIVEWESKLKAGIHSTMYSTDKTDDAEVSTIFLCRSFFLPPDDHSEVDSAYVTQSECMMHINDVYDASRQRGENFHVSSAEMEAISLGERSV